MQRRRHFRPAVEGEVEVLHFALPWGIPVHNGLATCARSAGLQKFSRRACSWGPMRTTTAALTPCEFRVWVETQEDSGKGKPLSKSRRLRDTKFCTLVVFGS